MVFIGWVRFDSFPGNRIIAMYVSVLRDNDPAPTEEARRTCWVNNLKFKTPLTKKKKYDLRTDDRIK